MNKHFGKYRAVVTNVSDPDKRNRIRVKCPALLDDYESGWCIPCYPILTSKITKLPKKGDPVWIEFEQGDIDKPIWVGSWKELGK